MVVVPNLLTSVPDGHGGSTYLPFKIHPKMLYDTPTMYDSILVDSVSFDTVWGKKGYRLVDAPYAIVNDVSKIDTIDLGVVDIPYASYDMKQSRLSIVLSSMVENSSKNTSELWLDCFILEPVVE